MANTRKRNLVINKIVLISISILFMLGGALPLLPSLPFLLLGVILLTKIEVHLEMLEDAKDIIKKIDELELTIKNHGAKRT